MRRTITFVSMTKVNLYHTYTFIVEQIIEGSRMQKYRRKEEFEIRLPSSHVETPKAETFKTPIERFDILFFKMFCHCIRILGFSDPVWLNDNYQAIAYCYHT